jgi:hypothetical protein
MSKNSIARAVSVAASFEEKQDQISISTMEAFGIELTTRYGKCDEMIGMLQFAHGAANCGAAVFVKSLFYESSAYCCFFEFHQNLDPEANDILLAIARETLPQFDWMGIIYHGNKCGCTDCIDAQKN